MIRMKAIRSGNFGDGGTKVRAGREFDVSTEGRADELEHEEFAYRLTPKAKADEERQTKADEGAPNNKMDAAPIENKAADTGPLASVGGVTGASAPPLSSQAAQAPKLHRSPRSPRGPKSKR